MVVTGGDEFDTFYLEEVVCWHLVGQVIEVENK